MCILLLMNRINIGTFSIGRQQQKALCLLLLFVLLSLVGCTPTTIPSALPAPTHTTTPEPSETPVPTHTVAPTHTPVPTTPTEPASILPFQLDIFPDVFAPQEIWENYGRVPVFTLYEDGTLIYAPSYYDDEGTGQAMI